MSRFLRICNQSVQKVLKEQKKFFSKKFNMSIKKRRISRWFRIHWKSFEKMHPKKLLAKTWRKYALFSLLLMFVKLDLLVTFFWCIFYNVFNGFEISVKFCFFNIFLIFCQKIFFGVILALFANFEAKCAKNGSKNQKTYFVNVSQISISHPSKGQYSSFSKKKSNSLYPNIQYSTVLFQ